MKKFLCTILVISLFLSLISCAEEDGLNKNGDIKKRYLTGFSTTGTLYDYSGSSEKDFEAVADRVEAELLEYHKLYDIYHEYPGMTNLATLNKTAGTGAKKVDKKIIDLLTFSKEMYEQTDGKVNVAFGAVLSIWHEYRDGGKGTNLPPMEDLRIASEHTDISELVIDEKNMTVELRDPKMSLDVGAVGKGFAVEKIAEMLKAEGKSGYVIDMGRNLRAVGSKPNGSGWSAGVVNPDPYSSQSYVYTLTISDCALVTSGSYENNYTVEGSEYHHIIHPDTLMPENYYISVSVKSSSSALSDALSTAIFNMKYEEAASFVNSHPDVFVILVMPNGEVRTLGNQ